MIFVQTADFDSAMLLNQLRQTLGAAAGAIVTFTGYVRDYAPDLATDTLFLDHYPGMCERELANIASTASQRWPLAGTLIAHRVGALTRESQIVFVAAASAHRGDAFRGCEYMIDALKTRAPFWKRETLSDGKQFWVEQRESDLTRSKIWEPQASATKEHS